MSERQHVANDLAHDLGQVETAIDAAIVAVSGFMGRLPAYRREAALSTVVGQDVFVSLGQAANHLVSAQGAITTGHHKLDVIRRGLKLQPVTAGGPVDKSADNAVPPFEVA